MAASKKRKSGVTKRSSDKLNTKWLQNALKSAGVTFDGVVKEIMPNTHEAVTTFTKPTADLVKNLRQGKNSTGKVLDALKSNKYVGFASKAIDNAIKDIKSGNFNNEGRMQEAIFGNEQDSGFSFGDEDESGNVNINVSGGDSETVTAIRDLSDTMSRNTVAQLKTQKAALDANIAVQSTMLQQQNQTNETIINELVNVNSNLSAIVQFNQENQMKFIEAATTFFDKMGDTVVGKTIAQKEEEKRISGASLLKNKQGGIDLAGYKKYVKQQFKEAAKNSNIGFLADMVDDDMINQFVSNPLGLSAGLLVQHAMPKMLTATMEGFETAFSNFMPTFLTQVADLSKTQGNDLSSRLKRFIGNVFGLSVKSNDRGVSNTKINRDAIPFDGETKHAITSVITNELATQTQYLRIIAEATDPRAKNKAYERRESYNYRAGKNLTKQGTSDFIAKTINDAVVNAMMDSTFGEGLQGYASSRKNKKERKIASQDISEFLMLLSQFNGVITESSLNDIIGTMNVSQNRQNQLSGYLKEMQKKNPVGYQNIRTAHLKGREARNNVGDQIYKDNAGYGVDSSFYKFSDTAEKVDRLTNYLLGYGPDGKKKKNSTRIQDIGNVSVVTEEDTKDILKHYTTSLSNAMSSMLRGDKQGFIEAIAGTAKDTIKEIGGKVSKFLFGEKNEEGNRENGIFSNIANNFKDIGRSISHIFTGKEYTDSKGNTHAATDDSVFGKLKSVGSKIQEGIMYKLFGKKKNAEGEWVKDEDKKGGMFGGVIDYLKTGIKNWRDALFGKEGEEEKDKEEIWKKFKETMKERLPDAATGGIFGAAGGLLAGSSLLGTMVGGPFGGAILGTLTGFVARSDKFQEMLFGKKDEETGERVGGIISKKVQNWASEHKNALIGGASIGALKGALLGGTGILGSLVGGPIAGAVLGMGTTILLSSKTFKTFLFGDEEQGKLGIFKKIAESFNAGRGKVTPEEKKGMKVIGAAGGAITGAIISKMGVLGASLSPLGPIGGAIAGLGLAIKASAGGFKEWLFGKKDGLDINGKKVKKEGIVGKIGNSLNAFLIKPIKSQASMFIKDIGYTFKHKILAPISLASQYIAHGVGEFSKKLQTSIKEGLGKAGKFLSDQFKNAFPGFVSGFSKTMGMIADTARRGITTMLSLPGALVKGLLKTLDLKRRFKEWSPIKYIRESLTALRRIVFKGVGNVFRLIGKGVRGVFKIVTAPFRAGGRLLAAGARSIGNKIKEHTSDKWKDRWSRFKDEASIYKSIQSEKFGEFFNKLLNREKAEQKVDKDQLKREKKQLRESTRNSRLIARYSKGQFGEDTDDAREWLRLHNKTAYHKLNLNTMTKDDIDKQFAEKKKGASIVGMTDVGIEKANARNLDPQSRLIKYSLESKNILERIADWVTGEEKRDDAEMERSNQEKIEGMLEVLREDGIRVPATASDKEIASIYEKHRKELEKEEKKKNKSNKSGDHDRGDDYYGRETLGDLFFGENGKFLGKGSHLREEFTGWTDKLKFRFNRNRELKQQGLGWGERQDILAKESMEQFGRRMRGGPLSNRLTLVGERGPELIVNGGYGYQVLSNKDSKALLSSMHGGYGPGMTNNAMEMAIDDLGGSKADGGIKFIKKGFTWLGDKLGTKGAKIAEKAGEKAVNLGSKAAKGVKTAAVSGLKAVGKKALKWGTLGGLGYLGLNALTGGDISLGGLAGAAGLAGLVGGGASALSGLGLGGGSSRGADRSGGSSISLDGGGSTEIASAQSSGASLEENDDLADRDRKRGKRKDRVGSTSDNSREGAKAHALAENRSIAEEHEDEAQDSQRNAIDRATTAKEAKEKAAKEKEIEATKKYRETMIANAKLQNAQMAASGQTQSSIGSLLATALGTGGILAAIYAAVSAIAGGNNDVSDTAAGTSDTGNSLDTYMQSRTFKKKSGKKGKETYGTKDKIVSGLTKAGETVAGFVLPEDTKDLRTVYRKPIKRMIEGTAEKVSSKYSKYRLAKGISVKNYSLDNFGKKFKKAGYKVLDKYPGVAINPKTGEYVLAKNADEKSIKYIEKNLGKKKIPSLVSEKDAIKADKKLQSRGKRIRDFIFKGTEKQQQKRAARKATRIEKRVERKLNKAAKFEERAANKVEKQLNKAAKLEERAGGEAAGKIEKKLNKAAKLEEKAANKVDDMLKKIEQNNVKSAGKAAKGAAKEEGEGILKRILKTIKDFFSDIIESAKNRAGKAKVKLTEKVFGKIASSKCGKAISHVWKLIQDKVIKKVAESTVGTAIKATLGGLTLGISELIFMGAEAWNKIENVAVLFNATPEWCDDHPFSKVIAGIIGAVCGTTAGSWIEIALDVASLALKSLGVIEENLLTMIATALYKWLASDEDDASLDKAKEDVHYDWKLKTDNAKNLQTEFKTLKRTGNIDKSMQLADYEQQVAAGYIESSKYVDKDSYIEKNYTGGIDKGMSAGFDAAGKGATWLGEKTLGESKYKDKYGNIYTYDAMDEVYYATDAVGNKLYTDDGQQMYITKPEEREGFTKVNTDTVVKKGLDAFANNYAKGLGLDEKTLQQRRAANAEFNAKLEKTANEAVTVGKQVQADLWEKVVGGNDEKTKDNIAYLNKNQEIWYYKKKTSTERSSDFILSGGNVNENQDELIIYGDLLIDKDNNLYANQKSTILASDKDFNPLIDVLNKKIASGDVLEGYVVNLSVGNFVGGFGESRDVKFVLDKKKNPKQLSIWYKQPESYKGSYDRKTGQTILDLEDIKEGSKKFKEEKKKKKEKEEKFSTEVKQLAEDSYRKEHEDEVYKRLRNKYGKGKNKDISRFSQKEWDSMMEKELKRSADKEATEAFKKSSAFAHMDKKDKKLWKKSGGNVTKYQELLEKKKKKEERKREKKEQAAIEKQEERSFLRRMQEGNRFQSTSVGTENSKEEKERELWEKSGHNYKKYKKLQDKEDSKTFKQSAEFSHMDEEDKKLWEESGENYKKYIALQKKKKKKEEKKQKKIEKEAAKARKAAGLDDKDGSETGCYIIVNGDYLNCLVTVKDNKWVMYSQSGIEMANNIPADVFKQMKAEGQMVWSDEINISDLKNASKDYASKAMSLIKDKIDAYRAGPKTLTKTNNAANSGVTDDQIKQLEASGVSVVAVMKPDGSTSTGTTTSTNNTNQAPAYVPVAQGATQGGKGNGIRGLRYGLQGHPRGGRGSLNGGTYFSQKDGNWSNVPYGNDGATLADTGCGPTAVAMALNDAGGKGPNPTQVAQFAEMTGDRDETGTNWNFINKAANASGFGSKQAFYPSADYIRNELDSGNPVILSGAKGSGAKSAYTDAGHYVVAEDYDDDGNIIVNDPRGPQFSGKYDSETLADETGSAWTIGGFGKKKKKTATKPSKKKGTSSKKSKKKKTKNTTDTETTSTDTSSTGSSDSKRDAWVSVVKAVKKAIAEQVKKKPNAKHKYYSQSFTDTIVIDGKKYKHRPDCTGLISLCLQVYGVVPKGTYSYSGSMVNKSDAMMKKSGFHYRKWTGWNDLKEGDIIVRNGHGEIFCKNEGGSHYVYNNGGDESVKSPGPTKTGHAGYTTVWEPTASGHALSGSDSDTTTSSSSGSTSSSSGSDSSDPFEKFQTLFGNIVSEAKNAIFGGRTADFSHAMDGVNDSGSFDNSSSSDIGDLGLQASQATGKGNFPKYNLSNKQIAGIAGVIAHEQGSLGGKYAEASLMANHLDIDGKQHTPDELVKWITKSPGWFSPKSDKYRAKKRYNEGIKKKPKKDMQAVKDVIVEGHRTLPRYVNEHDYIGDINHITLNGKSYNKKDYSKYIPYKTVVHQGSGVGGGKWTFFTFPSGKKGVGDAFGYTSKGMRKKWGDDFYDVPGMSSKKKKGKKGGKGDGVMSPYQEFTNNVMEEYGGYGKGFGKTAGAMTAENVLKIAAEEIGYKEKKSKKNLYSKNKNAASRSGKTKGNITKYMKDVFGTAGSGNVGEYAWCAAFVCWCMIKAGGRKKARKALYGNESMSVFQLKTQFKLAGKYKFTKKPKRGWLIFFNHNKSDSSRKGNHVGFVESVKNGKVYTIEGNTNPGNVVAREGIEVCRKSYSVTNGEIMGYGIPDYEGKMKATSRKKHKAGKATLGTRGGFGELTNRLSDGGYGDIINVFDDKVENVVGYGTTGHDSSDYVNTSVVKDSRNRIESRVISYDVASATKARDYIKVTRNSNTESMLMNAVQILAHVAANTKTSSDSLNDIKGIEEELNDMVENGKVTGGVTNNYFEVKNGQKRLVGSTTSDMKDQVADTIARGGY